MVFDMLICCSGKEKKIATSYDNLLLGADCKLKVKWVGKRRAMFTVELRAV